MDPNKTLADLINLSVAVLDNADEDTSELLIEFAEGVQNLNRWIKMGGMLPTEWAQG